MVARRRARARPVSAPRRIVTVTKIGIAALKVSIITGGKHCAIDPIEQGSGLLGASRSTHSDIARADKHVRAGGRRWRRWSCNAAAAARAREARSQRQHRPSGEHGLGQMIARFSPGSTC
jgi:hypothetical protein